jgi:hypothetical protein
MKRAAARGIFFGRPFLRSVPDTLALRTFREKISVPDFLGILKMSPRGLRQR